MRSKKTAGLIVAAGMSSRMKAFKPLLKLGEKTFIEHVVDTLTESGVEEIVVVTGNRAEDIVRQLSRRKIHFIYNENYTVTSMFHSVKLGLEYLKHRCDEFFFLPGDIPLFRSHSVRAMKKLMDESQSLIVQPMYEGKHGHPVLFSSHCIPNFLVHDGTNGLKGAMENFLSHRIELELPDRGILMDADTQEDYRELYSYYLQRCTPTSEECMEILRYFNTDSWIIEHCAAVAQLAKEIAIKLENAGHLIDIKLVEAGALLHDVARREKEHAACGAQWLRELGYFRVAEVVEAHMDVPADAVEELDERAIVYLADKLFVKNQRVDIDERFEKAMKRFGENPEVVQSISTRMSHAKSILEKIEQRIGGTINENSRRSECCRHGFSA